MSALLGPNGQPISSAMYKKDKPLAMGPSFGQWYDDPGFQMATMPGGGVLYFDLEGLTLADYRAMRYHPQINACLSVLTFMLHQVDWHIECRDKKIATKLEEILRPRWTRLVRAISQSFWAGYSPIALEYENELEGDTVSTVINKFKDLQPESCQVHWKTVEGGYAPPGMSKPKFKVYDGIRQHGTAYPIPAENTLWYPLLMENGNYYGRKLLKAAFVPWYFSTLMHLFANRYYERFGEPVPIGRAPFDDTLPTDDGKMITGKQAMEGIIARLRNRSVVVLPNDIIQGSRIAGDKTAYEYSIEYLESQMRGADFERYMTRLDEEMSLALFTPLLLLRNADVGSHNLGVQHTQTWLWMLNALTGDMGEYITNYPVQRLKAYNFSTKAPRATWKVRPMGKESVETLRAVITELLRGGKVGVDIDELGQALGMTLKEVRAVTRDDPDAPDGGNEGNPESDDRVGRDRGRTEKPRGVGEPRQTGKNISNRVRGQVEKAWREERFGAGFMPTLGYRLRLVQSFVAEGMARDAAESVTARLYERMDTFLNDAVGLGREHYEGPADFMALFDRMLDITIEDCGRAA